MGLGSMMGKLMGPLQPTALMLGAHNLIRIYLAGWLACQP
jgi:hypothetical protein